MRRVQLYNISLTKSVLVLFQMLLLVIIVNLCITVYSRQKEALNTCISKCLAKDRKCEKNTKHENKVVACTYKLETCEGRCAGFEPEMTLEEYICLDTECVNGNQTEECLAAVETGEKGITECSYETFNCQRKCKGLGEVSAGPYITATQECHPKLEQCTNAGKSYLVCTDEYKICFNLVLFNNA